jgi:uncharacterized membrane protein YczE
MLFPPELRGGPLLRSAALLLGLALFALGIVLLLESELGLAPWDVLNQGIAERTPLTFGAANVAVALLVLAAAWRLGARVGLGTVANAVLIGAFVDLLLELDALAGLSGTGLPVRAALVAAGILLIGLGSGFYIGASMGAGPRDSLMLVLVQRTRVRIGIVRTLLEASVVAAGFALGGTVGVGTLAFVLGIGPAVELAFWLLARLGLAGPAPAGERAGGVAVASAPWE